MDQSFRKRALVVFIVIILGFTGVVFRMAYIHVVKGERLRNHVADDMDYRAVTVANRGTIYDRNMQVIAYSEKVKRVFLVKIDLIKEMRASTDKEVLKKYEDFIEDLADALSMLPKEIEALIDNADSNKVILRTDVRQDEYDRINPIYHGFIQKDVYILRKYPYGNVASNILGLKKYAKDEDSGVFRTYGLSGVEGAYEDYLRGGSGYVYTQADGKNIELVNSNREEFEAVPGKDLKLTIDILLQSKVEDILKDAYQKHDVLEFGAVIMDVKSGEILTMAQMPNVDLNDTVTVHGPSEEQKARYTEEEYQELISFARGNRLLAGRHEFGSTYKLITAAIAIETNNSYKDKTYSEGSRFYIGDTYVSCWQDPHRHDEVLTLQEAVRDSCNPVFVRLLADMGIDTFLSYLERFGLNQPTDIDIPGEQTQSVNFNRSFVDYARYTFGQGLSVTPIRLVTSLASVFNGGELLRPYLVDEVFSDIENEKKVVKKTEKLVKKMPISSVTSATMREIMTFTVEEAYNEKVGIAGYGIGGKTGTAQVFDNDLMMYSSDDFIASFVAGIPMHDPKYELFVYARHPQTGDIYGSKVAVPVAGEILKEMVSLLNIPRTEAEVKIAVPNVVGLTIAEAKEVIDEAGFGYIIQSNNYTDESVITSQNPKEGFMHGIGKDVHLKID